MRGCNKIMYLMTLLFASQRNLMGREREPAYRSFNRGQEALHHRAKVERGVEVFSPVVMISHHHYSLTHQEIRAVMHVGQAESVHVTRQRTGQYAICLTSCRTSYSTCTSVDSMHVL